MPVCGDCGSRSRFTRARRGADHDAGATQPPDEPGDDEVGWEVRAGQPTLLFVRVPERKSLKNRIHLDLEPEQPRDEEVERISALGAVVVEDRRKPNGRGWVVFADPAGNEFCVEGSADERAVAERANTEAKASKVKAAAAGAD